MWLLIVDSARNSASAISALVWPSQTRLRTWRSRWERLGRSTPARSLRGTTDWPLSTARTLAARATSMSGSEARASAPASSVRSAAVAVERGAEDVAGEDQDRPRVELVLGERLLAGDRGRLEAGRGHRGDHVAAQRL